MSTYKPSPVSSFKYLSERLGLFSAVWAVVTALGFVLGVLDVKVDLWLNGWLKNVPFSWKQFLTTRHFPTLLYLHDHRLWLLFSLAVAAVIGLIAATSAVLNIRPRRFRRSYR